jgi:hypothetical protein
MNSSFEYRCGPCENCGKYEGGFMTSSAWGHHHRCCSEACGKRLGQKIQNGMCSPRAKHYFEQQSDDARIAALRIEIKKLRHQLKR